MASSWPFSPPKMIDKKELIRCLINCPSRVDLDTVDCDGKHLEILAR